MIVCVCLFYRRLYGSVYKLMWKLSLSIKWVSQDWDYLFIWLDMINIALTKKEMPRLCTSMQSYQENIVWMCMYIICVYIHIYQIYICNVYTMHGCWRANNNIWVGRFLHTTNQCSDTSWVPNNSTQFRQYLPWNSIRSHKGSVL